MTPDEIESLRHKLLAKGRELADMLSALLAGESPGGLDQLDAKPGETPEEKLRRYLGLVQSRLDTIAAGGGQFGRCERCGREIPFVELSENPLADVCAACAATGSGT